MDKRSDKYQPLTPTETPHGKEHSSNDGEEGQGVARDVAKGHDRNQNVQSSSRLQRHQRAVAIPRSDVGPNESPTSLPPSNGIVERSDIVLYGQEEPRATTARRIGQDSDESAAMTKPDPPQVRAQKTTVARRDLRTKAGVKESDKFEHSTSSSSSELQSPDMPQKEKQEIPEKHQRPAEHRKSSKASVGGASASSARLQASNVSGSKHMSHVSRSSSTATRMPNRLPSRASIKAAEGCPHSRAGPRKTGLEQVANSEFQRPQLLQTATREPARSTPVADHGPPNPRSASAVVAAELRRDATVTNQVSVRRAGTAGLARGTSITSKASTPQIKTPDRPPSYRLRGDSRSSAKSSRRSLRPIGPEEVPLDRIPEKPKGKLLLMPDGTYVNVQEKNLWIRAMQEKYLAIDYASCSLKFGFGLMLIGFIYIIMFRQGKHQSTTGSPTAPSPAQLTSQVARKYK
ncbi:hypothetical protein MRX96_025968 [Rhipicephalus microplus]